MFYLFSDRIIEMSALERTGAVRKGSSQRGSHYPGKSGLCIPCFRSDDEFPGSFRNLVDDSQTKAGNEQKAGSCDQHGGRRRNEKYGEGYGGQS